MNKKQGVRNIREVRSEALVGLLACRPVSLSACRLAGLSACLLVCLLAPAGSASGNPPAEGVKKVTILRQGGDPAHFKVEVAQDGPSIRKGLSGREFMPDDRGMLFILGDKRYSFWMKGMRFPIDVVTFDREGTVIEVISDLRPCDRCPLVKLPQEAAGVLEINAGLAKKLGITKGDCLEIKTGRDKDRVKVKAGIP